MFSYPRREIDRESKTTGISKHPIQESVMTTETRTPYRLKGVWLETCNCDAGCNCNFGGFPDHGSCQGIIGIAVQEGNYGNVDMAGVRAVVAAKWPKAIHDGDGKAVFFVDETASAEQAESLAKIFSGKVWTVTCGFPIEAFEQMVETCDAVVRTFRILQ